MNSNMRSPSISRTKSKYFLLFLILLCYSWPAVVSSFSSVPRSIRKSTPLRSRSDGIKTQVNLDDCSNVTTAGEIIMDNLVENEPELSCRVLGFYPFPKSKSPGILEWLLKDTHQAIIVTERTPMGETRRLRMDFMTKDGGNHPVWYDESTKWNVIFGGSIEGEVRVKELGSKTKDRTINHTTNKNPEAEIYYFERSAKLSKINRLIAYANDYDCRMNIYTNNCRIFAARMEREVERLNAEGRGSDKDRVVADVRCAVRIAWAAVLPTLYPAGAILLLCKGCFIQ